MLQLSFSTILMAVLFSNIVIALTAICFCHKETLVSIGYKMFAFLLVITLLRVIFPVQFSFTTNIELPAMLSRAISFLRCPFYQTASIKISIWNIFKLIWVSGILVKVILFIKTQWVFNHWIVWYGIDVTDKEGYSNLMHEIGSDEKYSSFRIIQLYGLKIPILYGIFRPRILIPADMEMSEDSLRYLLSHETSHHFHHDIITKIILNTLTIVYWWNPACYLLKAQLDAVLEMRIDNGIAGNTFDSKFGYLNCLVYIADFGSNASGKRVKVPENSIALFDSHTFNNLINRFHIMGETPKPFTKSLHVAILAITIALYLFSYLFIFEARYIVPEDNVFDTTDSSFYAVITENGTYEVYHGSVLLEAADTLENYHKDTPIYNSIDDVPEELRVFIEH